MKLQGRRILLAASGGIAAYKTPLVLRELVKQGAEVRVVLTKTAQQFVAPKTLEVLSGHPVHTELFERSDEFPVLHVGLAEWADLVLIAPATAHLIAKLAHGLADDLLSTLMLSSVAPALLAPAMEENMLLHAAVQANCESLQERGLVLLDPEVGELASGAIGKGRMAEPETIVERIIGLTCQERDLQGIRLLVTAGPTVEDLDPVRFVTNRSSGKMGFAVAQRALARGAHVVLVAGPTALPIPQGVDYHPVRSALEMLAVCEQVFDTVDGMVLAAAVADYRPAQVATEKMKRHGGGLTIELVENPDIAATLGKRKGERYSICFAMETEDGIERAKEKLQRKNGDLIALNNLRQEGAGFGVDTNIVTLIDAQGQVESLPQMSKLAVADHLLDRLVQAQSQRT